jgi:hypothetical protein
MKLASEDGLVVLEFSPDKVSRMGLTADLIAFDGDEEDPTPVKVPFSGDALARLDGFLGLLCSHGAWVGVRYPALLDGSDIPQSFKGFLESMDLVEAGRLMQLADFLDVPALRDVCGTRWAMLVEGKNLGEIAAMLAWKNC